MKKVVSGMWKRIIILLLIFSILCSITGCGEEKEEIPASSRLEGLWKEVVIPEIIKWDEMDYMIYVDWNEINILPSLNRNISHGIVGDVKQRGMEMSELGVFEIKRVVFWDGIYHAFLKSDKENEIYMLLKENEETTLNEDMPMSYIVAVDLRADGNAETLIWDGAYSYNSILKWDSYRRLDEGEDDGSKLEVIDKCHLYHSSYRDAVYYALYDYYERNGLDNEVTWIVDGNSLYGSLDGVLLDVFLYNDEEEMALLIDVLNKKYTVLE